jgi:hypothetical protein
MKKKQAFVAGLTAVVLGGTVGVTSAGTVSAHSADWSDQGGWHEDMGDGQHVRIRAVLNASLREHAAITVPALKAHLLQEPDEMAIMQAVDQNSMAVASTVEQAYPGTHDQFLALWRQHITYYVQYLDAAKAGDEAGKQQAKQNLTSFVEQVTMLLTEQSDRLDANEVEEHLAMHGDRVTSIIDNLVSGNYDQVYMLSHEEYEHMGEVAHVLARGKVTED